MKKIFFLCLLLSKLFLHGQGNNVSFTYTSPTTLNVCDEAALFTCRISNITTNTLTGLQLTVKMPVGMNYNVGSLSGGTELNTTIPHQPILTLADLGPAAFIDVSFKVNALCAISDSLQTDSDLANVYYLDYTGNFDSVLTLPYNVTAPTLTFQSITNQSYSGNVGNVFSRTISITNSGNGRLDKFTLEDLKGSGISVLSASPGTFSILGNTSTLVVSSTEFATIGNNNGYLDPGETVIITENIQINACVDLTSDYNLFWGCNSTVCSNTTENGNVTILPGVPNLAFTINNTVNTCYGSAPTTQTIKIKNNGTEPARNILIDIYQATSNTVWSNTTGLYMYFDLTTVGFNYHGVVSPATIDSFYRGNLTTTGGSTNITAIASCLGKTNSDPLPGRFFTTYPILSPGDSVTLTFQIITCCPTTCNFNGSTTGWRYKIDYKNQCLNNNYTSGDISGRGYSSFYENTQVPTNPSDLNNGQSGSFNLINDALNTWVRSSVAAQAVVEVEFTLPATLTFVNAPGNILWYNAAGTSAQAPTTVTVLGSIVTARFPYNSITNQQNSETRIILTGNCGASGNYTIPVNTYMIHNTTCPTCRMLFRCTTFTVAIHCPGVCPTGGFSPNGLSVKRITYGTPDNDNNGIDDGAGALDFSKIKTDRAIFGDTIEAISIGKIVAGVGPNVTWSKLYNKITFPEASNTSARCDLRVVSATATIFDKSTGLNYTCILPAPTITNIATNNVRSFVFDASASTLAACLPPGFLYQDGDSVSWNFKFRQARNIDGNIHFSQVKDTCYTSNVANPTGVNRFYCDVYNGQISFVGYYWTTWGPDAINTNSCNLTTLNQNYYLSIGPCCSNYAGGNMFPYEFRQFGFLDTVIVQIPTGYKYSSARLNQVRTAGSNITITSPNFVIAPIDPNANPLKFYVGSLFGTSIPLSDDGYHGTYTINIVPSCEVVPLVNSPVTYTTKFSTPPMWVTSSTSKIYISNSGNGDFIYYQAPTLQLQSALPTINAEEDSVYWDVIVSNISNFSAANTWIIPQNNSGKVTVYRVQDLGTLTDLTQTSGSYRLNTFNASTNKTYRIYAKFTNCNSDSVIVNVGWNCTGYPTSLATFPCTPLKIALKIIPSRPIFQTSVIGPVGSVNLCDTLDYEVTITNTNTGHGYKPTFTIQRPSAGMTFVPGSAEFSFPSGAYTSMPNPKIIGNYHFWSLDTINSQINTKGIEGSNNSPNNQFKIKFKMVTSCSFVSGTYLKFYSGAKAGCTKQYSYVYSSPVVTIAGAPSNYTTSISSVIDTLKSCSVPITIKVKMVNLGPAATNSTDSLKLFLPQHVTYNLLSTNGLHNPPLVLEPVIGINGVEQKLSWPLPSAIAMGDSVVLTIQVFGSNSLSTSTLSVDFQSTINSTLTCGLSTCVISAVSGTSIKNLEVIRPAGLWMGTVDRDWFNPLNWGDCNVPDCAVDVIIPDVANDPLISLAGGTAQSLSLTIQSSSLLELESGARLNICGDFNNSGTFLAGLNSNVHFTGSSLQNFNQAGIANFENIFMNQASNQGLNLNNDLIIDKTLTLNMGKIISNSNEVFVTSGSGSNVTIGNISSYVEGDLRRNINSTGTFYLPVGNATFGYELAELIFSNIGGITQLFSNFNNWLVSPPTLNQSECGGNFTCEALNHGYWVINATNPGVAPLYDVKLHNRGYSNLCNGWTVMKRPTGSAVAWDILDGYCDPASTALITVRHDLSQFSEFSVAQSPNPLPVENLNLIATPLSNSIQLDWFTDSEKDNKGFELQKSLDAVNFQVVSFVAGNVNSNERSNYNYADFDVEKDIVYYYRLKQIDLNGSVSFSNIVESKISSDELNLNIYPNPNNGAFTISLSSLTETFATYELFDLTGKLIQSNSLNVEKGLNKFSIENKNLASGTYLLKINIQNMSKTQKIFISK